MARTARRTDEDFDRQNELAIREARESDRIEPRAQAISYDARKGLVVVELRSGFAFAFPPERVGGLERASAAELSKARVSPSGDGLHWDALDVQASLTGLMTEALNLTEWAPRLMGQVRSAAKARAARANGLKGGRPRGSGRSRTKSRSRT